MMKIMNVVWPITGFYMPLFGLWAYRKMSMTKQKHQAMQKSKTERPFWQKAFVSTSHCGAECTYGDIIGEFAIFFVAATLLGVRLWASYLVDFVLAFSLGIMFVLCHRAHEASKTQRRLQRSAQSRHSLSWRLRWAYSLGWR
jgi:hypothetical protein